MSLTVYTSHKEVRDKKIKYIRINDIFFNSFTELTDSKITRIILSTIDKAEHNSKLTFIGRSSDLGALNKNFLSTGSKTLLNIVSHKDICFDVSECGNNALCLLPLIREGYIYWANPVAAYSGDGDCDILYNGKRYTDFYKFLERFGE